MCEVPWLKFYRNKLDSHIKLSLLLLSAVSLLGCITYVTSVVNFILAL